MNEDELKFVDDMAIAFVSQFEVKNNLSRFLFKILELKCKTYSDFLEFKEEIRKIIQNRIGDINENENK